MEQEPGNGNPVSSMSAGRKCDKKETLPYTPAKGRGKLTNAIWCWFWFPPTTCAFIKYSRNTNWLWKKCLSKQTKKGASFRMFFPMTL